MELLRKKCNKEKNLHFFGYTFTSQISIPYGAPPPSVGGKLSLLPKFQKRGPWQDLNF